MTTITTVNPATGERLHEHTLMSTDEALQIAQHVSDAGKAWKKTSFAERRALFLKLAKVLRAHKQPYAEMITREMGKVMKESLAEVEKCAWLAEVLAEKGEQWLAEELVDAGGEKHVITYEPLGTIYLVMPWNYPFWQPYKVGLLPLFAGNTILLKHAKNVTGSSLLIEKTFTEAGFPPDVFRSVVIGHDTSDALIDSPLVHAVSLTGSVSSGSKIAARAGKNIKKTVLELGGSDPFIVCDDADLEQAAQGAVAGRMGNCGQVCIGAKRIIVHRSVADQFVSLYVDKIKHLRFGDPLDPQIDIGPLVDMQAVSDMESFVLDAVQKGAQVATGGSREGSQGCFFQPTVLVHTSEVMRAVREEVFGPVVPIIVVDSDTEAVRIANDSVFGLNASVWTKNLARGEALARQLECGGVFVNHISSSHPLLPLGGVKLSGYGRELSHLGIKEFVNIKPINIYK